jgi:SAM-dependent methyltransferase
MFLSQQKNTNTNTNTNTVISIYNKQQNYMTQMDNVYGWLKPSAAQIIAHSLRWQTQHSIKGDILEIGTFYGKLFVLLALSRIDGEKAIGIDVFEDQHLNHDQSGFPSSIEILKDNILKYMPLDNIDIIKADSMTLAEDFIQRYRGIRWMHIDGSHTREATVSDLRLAERLVIDGGIVAVDDIYRPNWAGVTAGIYEYLHTNGKLIPFAVIPEKLLLTTSKEIANAYKNTINETFAELRPLHNREWQNFFGNETTLLLRDLDDPNR